MTPDTLWIDADRAICTVTWRGQMAVDGPDQPGRVLIAIEEQGQRLSWTSVATLAGLSAGGTVTVDPAAARRPLHTLPFHAAEPTTVSALHPALRPPSPVPGAAQADGGDDPRVEAPAPMPPAWILGDRPPRARGPAAAPDHASADAAVGLADEALRPRAAAEAVLPDRRAAGAQAAAFELVWAAPALARRLRADPGWARLLPAPGEQVADLDAARVLARGEPRRGRPRGRALRGRGRGRDPRSLAPAPRGRSRAALRRGRGPSRRRSPRPRRSPARIPASPR